MGRMSVEKNSVGAGGVVGKKKSGWEFVQSSTLQSAPTKNYIYLKNKYKNKS